jgi:opacity protein-like surface antigen
MRRTNGLRAMLCIVMMLGFSSSSGAQDAPSAEFSAGWRLLNVPDAFGGDSQTLPLGWYADVAGSLNRLIAVVGEVSGNYKSFEETTTRFGVNVNVDANLNVHTFMGGLRFSARQPAFVPYAQVLFGIARTAAEVEGQATVAGRTFSVNESDSNTDFAFDAGGGVIIDVSDSLGVRVGASYLRVGGDDGGNAFRFGAGVVIPF